MLTGIYHDSLFTIPEEPKIGDPTTITLRVPKTIKVKNIKVLFNYDILNKTPDLTFSNDDVFFNYYTRTFTMPDTAIGYHFEIIKESNNLLYFDALGVIHNRPMEDFILIPDVNTPEWSHGAINYQIFVDRFCDGDPSNNVKKNEYIYHKTAIVVSDWEKNLPSQAFGYKEFYGGDIFGISTKWKYLEELGIESLYLNPIFLSASVHGYDTQDYFSIDPHLGVIIDNKDYKEIVTSKKNLKASNALFAKLVQEAHSKGIKIILDGVSNHSGSTHKWCDEFRLYGNGILSNPDSPHKNNFYYKDGRYTGWWGHKSLPKLSYHSKEVWDYMLEVGKYWVSEEFDIDGWRLDVAEDLGDSQEQNIAFWKDFNKNVKSTKKDTIIFAETYNSPSKHIKNRAWDGSMNYSGCMSPVTEFLCGVDNHSEYRKDDLLNNSCNFVNTVTWSHSQHPMNSKFLSLIQLSNHDHSRWMTRTTRKCGRLGNMGHKAAGEGRNVDVFKEGMVMLFSLPGSPGVYYGDELGMEGWHDPDNRRPMPWSRFTEENKDILKFTKSLIKFYKNNSALRKGSFTFLSYDCGFISYGGWNKKDKYITCINNEEFSKRVEVKIWKAGINNEEITEYFSTKEIDIKSVIIEDGILKITLPKQTAVIFSF